MTLATLNERVKQDLSFLDFNRKSWVRPLHHPEGHVYDTVIIGGGQCGLGIAFGLMRERIFNILVLDENAEGREGPWVTYARMATLRTPKELTPVDFGVPSLTFRAWWVAQYGAESWDALDKIPREDWMRYLRWYRNVLSLPVKNQVHLDLVEPLSEGLFRLHVSGAGASTDHLLARKVVLATGIQGGGTWYTPPVVTENLPHRLYAHTSENIPFDRLKGKKIAVLGGGASAFDNANFALKEGAAEVHIFVRRKKLPRVNPIRQMEPSGLIEHFQRLTDAEKYAVMAHFFKLNQPPTNDMFRRASSHPGFHLHLHSPWLSVTEKDGLAVVTTPDQTFTFDFLIISTGLRTDPALRPELRLVEKHIARWGDHYRAPEEIADPILDAHPCLSPGFGYQSRDEAGKKQLHGLYAFNYSGMISCGLSASALSGMKYSLPAIVKDIAGQLFQDDKMTYLSRYFAYDEPEFTTEWSGVH